MNYKNIIMDLMFDLSLITKANDKEYILIKYDMFKAKMELLIKSKLLEVEND